MDSNRPSRRLSRRTFVKSTAAAAAAFAGTRWTAKSWAAVAGANEGVRIATIGFNGRGENHIDCISKVAGLKLVALCDADKKILNTKGPKSIGPDARYQDMRKIFDDKNIDAVSIATPNHWHSLAAIWAIQAGKDVYVEKPISHNVSEGRRVVEFARKYGKIVQAGTQSRSSRQGIAQAVEYVHSGKLGKINIARGLCYKRRPTIGKVSAPTNPPETVDFDLWTGPAEKLPLMRAHLHYDWHWVWNTGNGDVGNQGIHEMDVARWFLGVNELSPQIMTVGGRKGYIDDGQTPNELIVWHGYPQAPLVFEVRGLATKKYPQGVKETMDKYKGADVGIIIECEGGYVVVPSYGRAIIHDPSGAEITKFEDKGRGDSTVQHFENFLKGVHSRNHEDLYADIEQGHFSSALCHTGNISYRLGKTASPDEIKEKIKADVGFEETFNRMTEHLAANQVDIATDQLTLGMPLKMDGKAETFIDNEDANKMLTRPYREGFVVPAKVS
jgi:predicted dehydrogenase